MGRAMLIEDKTVVVTGGTGSLGNVLVRRLLSGEVGKAAKVIVFSRDEAKQHGMRLDFLRCDRATDEVIYENFKRTLDFRIGDVRDYYSLLDTFQGADIVVNAAALKQVPTCEYFPLEASRTNVEGAANVARAAKASGVATVVGVSTDKACKPVNVMGMTKALQERIFISANIGAEKTRFVLVRYGNVLASRGSVIPLFLSQIERGLPVTVTTSEMTRFLMTLDQAVDTIFQAIQHAQRGEVVVPPAPSARILDLARCLTHDTKSEIVFTEIRPGEKTHEVLISEEEVPRTSTRDGFYYIRPLLPELAETVALEPCAMDREYTSRDALLDSQALRALLVKNDFLRPERA